MSGAKRQANQAFAFAAIEAITSGAFDPWLHRIRGAVLQRARTQEYQDTLIAGTEKELAHGDDNQ